MELELHVNTIGYDKQVLGCIIEYMEIIFASFEVNVALKNCKHVFSKRFANFHNAIFTKFVVSIKKNNQQQKKQERIKIKYKYALGPFGCNPVIGRLRQLINR